MKSKKKVILSMVFVLMMAFGTSIAAYAYSNTAYAHISKKSNGSIYFEGSYQTDASPSALDLIAYDTESSTVNGEVISESHMSDTNHRYNKFSSDYTLNNPLDSGYYKWVNGTVSYTGSYTDYDFDDYTLMNSSAKEVALGQTFIKDRTQQLAKTFNIDLSKYTQAKPGSAEFEKYNLYSIRGDINIKFGDSVPAYFLNSDNSGGIILKQDLNGVHYLYSFSVGSNGVSLTDTKSVQKEYIGDKKSLESYVDASSVETVNAQ